MLSKYKWYFIGALVIGAGVFVYFKFFRKTEAENAAETAPTKQSPLSDTTASSGIIDSKKLGDKVLEQDIEKALSN